MKTNDEKLSEANKIIEDLLKIIDKEIGDDGLRAHEKQAADRAKKFVSNNGPMKDKVKFK